ncbi:MAG: flagellar hook-associated protein FlgL [Bacteroidota bacterium]|nr:flagellar hook-associated protein FlgL [Bacteroidota bacterium]MDW8137892.1 flagellar hook-associated protein FlgL [Bacteroidota bacterium]
MRITNGMLHRQALRHLERLQERLYEAQVQIGTGYRLNRPSDDPAALVQASRLSEERALREQYLRNIDFSRGFAEATLGALDRILGRLSELGELAVRGANETFGPQERAALAERARSLLAELLSELNGRHGDLYLFSGTRVHTQPFVYSGGAYTYQGNTAELLREVGPNLLMALNLTGDRLQDLGGGQTLTGIVQSFITALETDDLPAIRASIERLEQAQTHVRVLSAEMGARLARLEALRERWMADIEGLEALRSRLEDADYAQAASMLERAQTLYTATAKVISWRLPQSLVDYLR